MGQKAEWYNKRRWDIYINAADDSFQEFFIRDQNETDTYDRIIHFKVTC